MPRPKRWFPTSHDLNDDPETWELTDTFGDRAIRLWLEILSNIDQRDNHWRLTGHWLPSLSRKVRQSSATVQRAIVWMLEKGWLIAEELSPDGSPRLLTAPKYWKYHRSQERKGNEVRTDAGIERERSPIPSEPIRTEPNLKKEKKEQKLFLSDSVEVRLSQLLFDLIRVRLPEAKAPNFQTWAKSVDLMIRQDHRTPEQIEAVIRFAHADPFWQSNILSTAKLREKLDQLLLKQQGAQRVSSSPRTARGSGFSPTAAALNAARQAEVAGR